mmetsp:Transcript_5005/g.16696  ORF Transcript_5005/g.16696 Transcript_5005/m.16696 type:complete len:218 (+) Transcript_5005:2787-3440(+)
MCTRPSRPTRPRACRSSTRSAPPTIGSHSWRAPPSARCLCSGCWSSAPRRRATTTSASAPSCSTRSPPPRRPSSPTSRTARRAPLSSSSTESRWASQRRPTRPTRATATSERPGRCRPFGFCADRGRVGARTPRRHVWGLVGGLVGGGVGEGSAAQSCLRSQERVCKGAGPPSVWGLGRRDTGRAGVGRVPTGPKKRKEKRNGPTPIAALRVGQSRN